ncbi:protein phosphatase Slingshot isoform X2 [Drosophila innubila]|uniref:protein phosphatase Slingshot isoform X2 n=1 Tax=Drosophila innubila TaxID=198719 RepID=UPI00148BBEEA|nr:protein phosphatase Slingshot isoform X2 [Drosophila innubila]
MGNGMNKVLPGLYVGNYRDSKDHQQLEKFKISHIIAIHDSPRRLLPDKHYLCVMASDTPDQNLSQYFSVCNDFIHAARLREGNVLIHCLAGMSRSVTVAVAYIMTATHLNSKEALKVVRAGRAVANPNTGFQTQLLEFEQYKLSEERRRLRERFPSSALEQLDRIKCGLALDNYQELLQNRDICEGNCSRGEKCPTGVCNMDPTKGLFRRRPSSASSTHSRLRAQSTNANPSSSPSMLSVASAAGVSVAGGAAQSCPTSPKHSPRPRRSVGNERIPEDEVACQQPFSSPNPSTSSEAAEYAAAIEDARREQQQRHQQLQLQRSPSRQSLKAAGRGSSAGGSGRVSSAGARNEPAAVEGRNGGSAQLQRSASTVSGFGVRPRSSPAGLHAYTGSVPSSAHGSRVDLREIDKGSAIYLGCNAPRASTLSIASSRGSSGGSAPPSPCHTPPSSPRHGIRRSTSLAKKPR